MSIPHPVAVEREPVSSERGDSSGPGCLGVLLIIGLIAIVGGAIGDLFGGGDDDKPANRADNGPFVISSSSVEQLVTDTGSGEDPDVRCDGRQFCEVSYKVEIIGIDTNQELVLAQSEVWKGMFDDPQFDGGVITLRGPVTSVGGKQSTADVLRVACNRQAARQINWGNVDADGMRALCNWQELVNFD